MPLRIQEEAIIPNHLIWLKEHSYVESKEEKVEDKTIVVYYITGSGKKACNSVIVGAIIGGLIGAAAGNAAQSQAK